MSVKPADRRYRRLIGILLGIALAVCYALVSQFINRAALPGVPFYQPPAGPYGNLILLALLGASLGAVNAWFDESIKSILIAAGAGAVLVAAAAFLTGSPDQNLLVGKLVVSVVVMLPVWGALMPFLGVHRWAVDRQMQARYDRAPIWRWAWAPVLLLLLAAGTGYFSLLRDYARVEIARTQALLQSGLAAGSPAALPEPLQHERVGDFLAHAAPVYTLEWSNRSVNRYSIARGLTQREWELAVVIARFENGWNLVCLYAQSDGEVGCRGFERLP